MGVQVPSSALRTKRNVKTIRALAFLFVPGNDAVVTVQVGLCIYCTDHTKIQREQAKAPSAEQILNGLLQVTVQVSELLLAVNAMINK